MRSIPLLVCFCIFFTKINGQSSCFTPNGDRAFCVSIHSCPKLYDAVTTKDKQQLKFLKQSQCGYRGAPYVCCGSYDNYHREEEEYGDEGFSWGGSSRRTTERSRNSDEFGYTNRRHENDRPGQSSDDEFRSDRRRNNNRQNQNSNEDTGFSSNRGPGYSRPSQSSNENQGFNSNRPGYNRPSQSSNEDQGFNSNRRPGNNRPSQNSNEDQGNYNRRPGNNRPSQNSNEDQGFNSNRGQSSGNLPGRSSCGFQAADRILDGQATSFTEFPWMALLQYQKKTGGNVFSCGGTLISTRYVLTAAHCVRGQILTKIGSLIKVRLGEHNTDTEEDCSNNRLGYQMCNDKPVDAQIEKVIVHPEYNENSADRYHDIALIKLKREVTTSDYIKPICLPSGSSNLRVGERLTVAGWGRTEYANSSPVKLKLRVPVAEKSQCTNKFKTAGVNLGNKQLCAGGEQGRDSCNGDSGGPLMTTFKDDSAQWYIAGVVSFGAKCGSEGWPGIYTKVDEYVDWIKSNAV